MPASHWDCLSLNLPHNLASARCSPLWIPSLTLKGCFIFVSLFQVYVLKRPHVDEFLQKMGELFECVLFTASLAKVCPPRCLNVYGYDKLFTQTVISWCFPLVWSVCWPCGRPAGPVGGVSHAALQGILCFPQRKLRQRPQPAGPRAQQSHHHRQLTCLLHLPPWKCSKSVLYLMLNSSKFDLKLP